MGRIPAGYGRQIAPEYASSGLVYGGIGPVPRRGFDTGTLNYLSQLADGNATAPVLVQQWAQSLPLHLLRLIIGVHPLAQFALESDLSLAFGPEDTQFVAVKDYRSGNGTVDDDMTAVLDNLWDSYRTGAARESPVATTRGRRSNRDKQLSGATEQLPQAAQGSITRLQFALGTQICETGGCVLEAVPGASGAGVGQAFDVDPLDILYVHDKTKTLRLAPVRKSDRYLDTRLIYDGAWRATTNNPYGVPRYGSFLSVGLDDITDQRNQTDWLHAVAWTRLAYEYPFGDIAQFARENPDECLIGRAKDGGDLTPGAYAVEQLSNVAAQLEDLKSNSIMVGPGKWQPLGTGNASGIEGVLQMRRLRLCQALQQLPNLMGITDGGTQAYASVQMQAHAKKLEVFRAAVNAALLWLANLHLRLMGVDMIARCETRPLLLTDLLQYHQAREVEIRNVLSLVDRGYVTDEEASVTLTGAGLPEDYEERKPPEPEPVPPVSDPEPAKPANPSTE